MYVKCAGEYMSDSLCKSSFASIAIKVSLLFSNITCWWHLLDTFMQLDDMENQSVVLVMSDVTRLPSFIH